MATDKPPTYDPRLDQDQPPPTADGLYVMARVAGKASFVTLNPPPGMWVETSLLTFVEDGRISLDPPIYRPWPSIPKADLVPPVQPAAVLKWTLGMFVFGFAFGLGVAATVLYALHAGLI